VAPH